MKTKNPNYRLLIKSILFIMLCFLSTNTFSQDFPYVFETEDRTQTCLGTTNVGPIASTTKLPDPFEFSDGSGRVSTFEEWNCRRNEIKAEIEHYEIASKPPKPDDVTAVYSGGTLTVTVRHNGKTVNISSTFSIPSGSGPHPVLISINGGIGSGLPAGVITARYSHDQVTSYNNGRSASDPFFSMYPELYSEGAGQYCAWAWGVSRLIDGLEIIADDYNIDMSGIGLVGCSYAGKMSLFSGALDDRIALVIVQESGGGGINAWRLTYQNSDVENICSTDGNWFRTGLCQNPNVLPHDHHELIGMIAPRACLIFGNEGWTWMGDPWGYRTAMNAMEIWKSMGIEDRFGFDFTGGHGHCTPAASQEAAGGAFVRKFLMHDDSQNTMIRTTPHSGDGSGDRTWTTPTISPPNTDAPQVKITSPEAGGVLSTSETVTIAADVTDSNNDVTLVEFYVNDEKIGEDNSAPYSTTWIVSGAGSYTICATATDAEGNVGTACVSNSVRGAYGGTPHAIPGKIEFEAFDIGGNGNAYYDTGAGSDVPNPPDFRSDEDVDIENCTDTDGGYNLGYTIAGEWLEYTVNVIQGGLYDISFRVASNGASKTMSLASNGQTIIETINIPNTGGWQEWETVIVEDVELDAGEQILRVTIGATDYINMNYMEFYAVDTKTPPTVTITNPADGANLKNTQSIAISANATATEAGASITDVTFFINNELISTDNTAPYSSNWSGMNVGSYTIKVEATDDNNVKATDEITVTVSEATATVSLRAGWNIIGCPLHGSTEISIALSEIWDKTTIVKDMESFYLSSQNDYLNTLKYLVWGKGYMIYVSEDCELSW